MAKKNEWAKVSAAFQSAGLLTAASAAALAKRGREIQSDFGDCSLHEAAYRLAAEDANRAALFDVYFFEDAGTEKLYSTALRALSKMSDGAFEPKRVKTTWPEGEKGSVALTFLLGKTKCEYALHTSGGYDFDWCLLRRLNEQLAKSDRQFLTVNADDDDDVDLEGVLVIALKDAERRSLEKKLGWSFHTDEEIAKACRKIRRGKASERAQSHNDDEDEARRPARELAIRAQEAWTEERAADALALLDQALVLEPDSAHWWSVRGDWQSDSDPRRAIADYTRSLELEPRSEGVYDHRGDCYREIGKLEAALADYDRAIQIAPAHTDSLNSRALIYLEKGDLARAEANCKTGLGFYPNNALLFCTLAEIYAASGRLKEGLKALARAVAIDPDWKSFALESDSVAALRALPDFASKIGR